MKRFVMVLTFLLVLLAAAVPAPTVAAQETTTSPEQQLAERFAPIAELRNQEQSCDRKGEAYFPAPVEIVLGNPEVALKQRTGDNSSADTVVMMGPTAGDLAGKDERYYLDFPGDPRHAGCTYESDFKRFVAATGAQPTTYARVVVDPVEGRLALQYWFWYYFNDWNNTHESDWEMIQLFFDAASAEEALAEEPVRIGYAQHGGGELAEWDDDEVAKEGDRPIVHPGAGSHGTYFGQAIYIGWGEDGTGFGCDVTTAPATRAPLAVVFVPEAIDPDGPLGWTFFSGRWGERQASEWNGPKSPNLGTKWRDPFKAAENWRDSSLRVPASRTIGPAATDFFCRVTEAGSRLVTSLFNQPALLLGIFLGILALIVALFVIKRQELGEAFRLYKRHIRLFAGIGLFTIPIGIAFNGFALLVRENPPVEWMMEWFNDTAGARLTAAAAVGGLQQIAMLLLIAPPVIQAVADIRTGVEPSIPRSFRLGYARIGVLALALVIIALVLGALTIVVIGIPLAIWLSVRWQFFGQATILDGAGSGQAALARSRQAVRGRWWQALGDSLVFQVFALLPGPLIGALLMLLGKASVDFANVASSVLYALTVPIAIIGLSLAYLRYQQRESPGLEPA